MKTELRVLSTFAALQLPCPLSSPVHLKHLACIRTAPVFCNIQHIHQSSACAWCRKVVSIPHYRQQSCKNTSPCYWGNVEFLAKADLTPCLPTTTAPEPLTLLITPVSVTRHKLTKTNDCRKKMWGGKSWFHSTIKMSVKTNEVWKQNVSHCAQHLAKTPLLLNSVHISQEKSAWLSTTASALKQECLERERSGCSCTLPSERGDGNPKQDKCKGCSPTKQKLVLTEWQAR